MLIIYKKGTFAFRDICVDDAEGGKLNADNPLISDQRIVIGD
jgi:hypothetical protein